MTSSDPLVLNHSVQAFRRDRDVILGPASVQYQYIAALILYVGLLYVGLCDRGVGLIL